MMVFLYLLAAMGVAYWSKLDRRNPAFWFAVSVVCTPLLASLLLYVADRYGW
jgi:hypothetical protein